MSIEKKMLRQQVKERKNAYTSSELMEMSKDIFKKLEKEELFKQANVIAIYWSLPDEVYTQEFIEKWSNKKVFLLPCIEGEDIVFRKYESKQNLKAGEGLKIPEPCGSMIYKPEDIELMIVPGMAFDKRGGRLGRGKGYYDRFMKSCFASKVGVCFPFQLVDFVPMEIHDLKVDKVLY
ncbi:MAG: 5-formyltetrahydrofolate cyclo-ligase [Odoribacter sp.]|nr:5-formyltetrahydrofolate cyclo-ligase [Odoribacter sp.]